MRREKLWVLYAEEPSRAREQLAGGLSRKGLRVDKADSLKELTDALLLSNFDAIVLDPKLPGGDALRWIAARRRRGDLTPILLLVDLGDAEQTIGGYRSGASFCVQRPLNGDVLAAHLGALVGGPASRTVKIGDLELDPDHGTLTFPDGKESHLTPTERRLFVELARNINHAVPRDHLIGAVVEDTAAADNNLSTVAVRLRRRLGPYAWMLTTVRNGGYTLWGRRRRDARA